MEEKLNSVEVIEDERKRARLKLNGNEIKHIKEFKIVKRGYERPILILELFLELKEIKYTSVDDVFKY